MINKSEYISISVWQKCHKQDLNTNYKLKECGKYVIKG